MDLFFFGLILVAYLAYLAVTDWHKLQSHLAIVWMVMGLHLVGLAFYAAYKLLIV